MLQKARQHTDELRAKDMEQHFCSIVLTHRIQQLEGAQKHSFVFGTFNTVLPKP
jgi:hypothetical protein